MHIGILGTGVVGQTIGARLTQLGVTRNVRLSTAPGFQPVVMMVSGVPLRLR